MDSGTTYPAPQTVRKTAFYLLVLFVLSLLIIGVSSPAIASSHNSDSNKEKRIETKFWFDTTEGRNNVMKFNESAERGVGFKKANFSCSSDVGVLRLTVSRAGAASIITELGDLMDSKVYRYLEVSHRGMEQCNPEEFEITFSIFKDWLEERNLIFNSASLNRYAYGWREINTTFLNSTNERFRYKVRADLTSSTRWAISLNATGETIQEIEDCGDGICSANESWRTCAEDCERPEVSLPEGTCWSCWGVIGFMVFLFGVVFYILHPTDSD